MKMIVNNRSLLIDNDRPWSSAGAILSHYSRYFMGLLITGCMGHGDFQTPFQLVFAQFVLGIVVIAFKHGLNREKFYLIYIFKSLRQFLKGWEPHPLATRSPVLKKIQIYDLAPVNL